jgi:PAS domain S-box-containing protein
VSLHQLLPLVALLLNVALGAIALFRNPRSPLNRVFTSLVSGMALWNYGVFMLRRAPDETTAYLWEIVIHVGVIPIPAFYYHFVLLFLDGTPRHRPSLALAYVLATFFTLINLGASSLFMSGVQRTPWGWAPTPGALYVPFFLCWNAFLIWGLTHLVRASRASESSFRRNRVRMVRLGTMLSLAGAFVDFLRFILGRFVTSADQIYPLGIPANMLFALLLGTSIVRYRLFDVTVAVKKTTVAAALGAALTASLALAAYALGWRENLDALPTLWVVVPLGIVLTLLVSPLGRHPEELVERLMFSKRRGCYDTLLDLGKRMGAILDSGRLAETLVQGLVRGVPLTRCVLMTYDPATDCFVARRQETTVEPFVSVASIRGDSPVVRWLRTAQGVLVVEEMTLNPRMAEYFSEGELKALEASLIVPLKVEDDLIGLLLLGEKLSGEIFDAPELEVLLVLANQAAIAIQNTRLYDEVRSARDFLHSIAENSADAIITTDVHGQITYFSPGAEELFGYRAEEVLDRPVSTFYERGEAQAREVMRRLAEEGRIRNYETTFQTKDGRRVEINASLSLLRDGRGPITGTLGIIKDVTERKKLEEDLRQSQKMEAVGRLAGGVAHDFNNLLQVIMGRSNLAKSEVSAGDPLHAELEIIEKASNQAANLTRQLLAFSRKQPLAPRVLDLNTVLAGIEPMLRRLIAEDIELVVAPGANPATVKADPGQLEQVILNLAVNARDAMPQGGRLTLATANADLERSSDVPTDAHVVLTVSDTGVGMEAETRAHIFEPFFTTKETGTGTGLGLATVYGIVQQHGGSITVESVPRQGTTFRIYLPRATETATPAEPALVAARAGQGSETVLLVEDDAAVRALTRAILDQNGYTVLEAGSGGEALEIGTRHVAPIHLLLTDVVMPKLSGVELADRLTSKRPDMKVLCMSGYTDEAVALHDVRARGMAFIEKPFTPASLARKVREVLDSPSAPPGSASRAGAGSGRGSRPWPWPGNR